MTTFSQLGLPEYLLKALTDLGFQTPTPIQIQSIPILLEGNRDLIGLAQTGTGKTAAFGLPLIAAIEPEKNYTQALIVVPTRELGQQVAQQLTLYSKFHKRIRSEAVYGGVPIAQHIKAMRSNPHIIIATPGRLIDLINRRSIRLEQISYVVLDEADEMLNMGFKEDIDKILSFTPKEKNTWLFSATMPKEIRNIVHKYMKDPAEVSVNPENEVNVNIEHQFAFVKASDKNEALERFLAEDAKMRAIVFCRTKIITQELAEYLKDHGYDAEALHGDMSQAQRDKVMKAFKKHQLQILIATDVAARGIDVNDVTHVIHHMLPDDDSYYTHRSGRTARAGKKGISLALVTKKDLEKIRYLERKLDISFSKVLVPSIASIKNQKIAHWAAAIKSTEVSPLVDNALHTQALEELKELSKEELVAKLITKELGHLDIDSVGNHRDLNETESGSRRDRQSDRGPRTRDGRPNRMDGKSDRRRERAGGDRSTGTMERYFINIGTVDNITKRDLAKFIGDHAQIPSRDIGDIILQKRCAFFEVDTKYGKKVANGFKNITVGGRKLRVNRDQAR